MAIFTSSFTSYDGTRLARHDRGTGEPLVCLPGGAMRASAYLDDLGGLDRHRRLVLLDLRGTGGSEVPLDESTYRMDRQVADVEALRLDLGLDRMDLLAHSAGGNLALLYAAAHPERVRSLVLVTVPARALDLPATLEHKLAAARLRSGEPWFEAAYPVFAQVMAGERDDDAAWELILPFFYGRWDDRAAAHAALSEHQTNEKAAARCFEEGVFDPPATREALRSLRARVLVLAGGLDGNPTPERAAETAALLPGAETVVQPGAGHFPWLDDPERFRGTVRDFLD
ncbi:alpha/beta hydrolase [Streptomyces sp. NPDC097619]|uniref:alpha/beta fold hydrolase n=1 Tax=Streptomyces sp. NPDC097619 TaxID=3157228 RepID=UPI003331DE96